MFFKYVFYFQLLLSCSRIFFTCQRSNIIFKLSFSFRVVGVLAAFAFSENTWSLLALLCTDFLPPKSLRHVALNSIKNTFYVQCRSLWLCTMTKYILTLDVMLTGAALNKKTPVYFFSGMLGSCQQQPFFPLCDWLSRGKGRGLVVNGVRWLADSVP